MSSTKAFIKRTEDDFSGERATCYFCKEFNDNDWNCGQDAVCLECGDKWVYDEQDDGYYNMFKVSPRGHFPKCVLCDNYCKIISNKFINYCSFCIYK